MAYLPNVDISDWKVLLTDADYDELIELFRSYDVDTESYSEVLQDYLTRPCE